MRRPAPRPLVVVGPGAMLWRLVNGAADYPEAYAALGDMRGALVRAQPPADVSPERVAGVEAALLAAGALAVRLLPSAEHPEAVQAEPVPAARKGVREVVEACAMEAHTRDREALREVLDAALAAEGL